GYWRIQAQSQYDCLQVRNLSGISSFYIVFSPRMFNGGLLIHSPVVLEEKTMKQIEELGAIQVIIAPSSLHTRDIGAFKRRYPEAKAICPKLVMAALQKGTRDDIHYNRSLLQII